MSILLSLLLAAGVHTSPAPVHSCQALREYDALVSAVASAVNGLLSGLHASHTGVYTAFSRNMNAFEINMSGVWPEKQDTKWFARYVLPGSPADAAGIVPGDELVSLNGREFDPMAFSARSASRLIKAARATPLVATVARRRPPRPLRNVPRRGRVCDVNLDPRSCLRFAPAPHLCLLASGGPPYCASPRMRLYPVE